MLKYISLRVYVYVLLLVLVLVGWLSPVSAFAITLLFVLFCIEHELRMMIVLVGSLPTPEPEKEEPHVGQ